MQITSKLKNAVNMPILVRTYHVVASYWQVRQENFMTLFDNEKSRPLLAQKTAHIQKTVTMLIVA